MPDLADSETTEMKAAATPYVRTASRWLVTLGAILFAVLAPRIDLPGVDAEVFELPRASDTLTPFAFGVTPIVTAFILVELAALVVPRWSRLRNTGPKGRAKLERAAAILAAVFILAQSASIVISLRVPVGELALLHGFRDSVIAGASLVGGTCVTLFVATFTTRRGLINGFVLIIATRTIDALVRQIVYLARSPVVDARGLALVAVAVAIPVAVTWLATTGTSAAGATVTNAREPYRGGAGEVALRPWIPIPASSAYPLSASATLLLFPASLASLELPGMRDLAHTLDDVITFNVVRIPIVIAMGLLFAWLFHREKEMTSFARRLGATKNAAHAEWPAVFRRSLVPTLAFLLAVVFAEALADRVPIVTVSLALLPLASAAARDLFAAARLPALVPVWEERRPYAVAAIRARLASEGVASEARGMGALSILQAFGPFAPVEILVREADAERATELLESLLLGKIPTRKPSPESAEPAAEAPPRSWIAAHRTDALAAIAALALCGFVAAPAALWIGKPPVAPAHRASLAIVRVADQYDPFADRASLEEDPTLPAGMAFYQETVPDGPDYGGGARGLLRAYARISQQEGEDANAIIARGLPWLQEHAQLPPGVRIAFEDVIHFDPDTGISSFEGVRTLLLEGEPIITEADILGADVSLEGGPPDRYYVRVTFTPDAGERFRIATRAAIQRRIAIVVDGRVDSAPVVKAEIGGGHVSIMMGEGEPEKQLADAKRLAAALDTARR